MATSQDRSKSESVPTTSRGAAFGRPGKPNAKSQAGSRSARGGPKSGRDYLMWEIWIVRAAVFVVLIGAWEIYGRSVSRALFAPPSAIIKAYYALAFLDDRLWIAIGQTLSTFALGLVGGVVAGVLIGIVMGRWRIIDEALDPYISFIYALPIIALVPLLLIWFGLGMQLRLAIVFIAVVLPVIINTSTGVKEVKADYLDVASVFCANERQIVWTVVFPSSIQYIFAGIRIGLAHALVAELVVEMVAINTGVGGMLVAASNYFQVAEVFAIILTVMAIGVFLTMLFERWREFLTTW